MEATSDGVALARQRHELVKVSSQVIASVARLSVWEQHANLQGQSGQPPSAHWLLCELLTFLKGQVPPTTCLAFIDSYAMSPYATRDPRPGSTAGDFEVVRKLLPGRRSTFELTWKDLSGVPRVEYPTSARSIRLRNVRSQPAAASKRHII